MYVDLFVFIALAIIVVVYSKRFQTYIFGFAMIDLAFRILNEVNTYIPVKSVKNFVTSYVPSSIPGLINKYTNGMVSMVLVLIYAVLMIIFLYFVIKIFVKRKKI